MLTKRAAVILSLIGLLMAGTCFAIGVTRKADDPLVYYHQGIAAKTIGARRNAFEKALTLYLASFNRMKKDGEINGLLCYNIGNCYFNLKQLGEAVYYYRLGLKVLPFNEKIQKNLNIALTKRENGVDIEKNEVLETLLFFHYRVSTADRINILIAACIILALLLLWVKYRPNTFCRYIAIVAGFIVLCLFVSLGVEYYAPNHEGVIINPADVRVDAGTGFAPITKNLLGAGSTIRVLSLVDGWYKVKLNDGRQGFIRQKNLKLVI